MKNTVGGVVEVDPAEVNFGSTYTFERMAHDTGQLVRWVGVRPVRGRDGRAVFNLPPEAGILVTGDQAEMRGNFTPSTRAMPPDAGPPPAPRKK